MRIEYCQVPTDQLDAIAELWDKLRRHQQVRSPHFAQHYARRTWTARRRELLQKAATGAIRIELAKNADSGVVVAYCVSTVSAEGQGTIESIFAEPEYRQTGIGHHLMTGALEWMDEKGATSRSLQVGVGNEEVLPFYARHGFYPRTIVVQQVGG